MIHATLTPVGHARWSGRYATGWFTCRSHSRSETRRLGNANASETAHARVNQARARLTNYRTPRRLRARWWVTVRIEQVFGERRVGLECHADLEHAVHRSTWVKHYQDRLMLRAVLTAVRCSTDVDPREARPNLH